MENNKKIESLLVMILLNTLKEANVTEKAEQLELAGLSHAEIGNFLKTKPAVIKQLLYLNRKTNTKKK